MLKKVLLVVSLGVLLATMAVASAGCASSSGYTAMLSKVPSDTTSFKYVDVKALRNDADLDDLYDAWKAGMDSWLEALGINHSDVSGFAHGSSADSRFTLLVGKFDLDDVRSELDDRKYDEDEYKGVEVWKREVGWDPVLESRVALMGNLIIMGDENGVEDCISVIKAGAASWLGEADVNDVASRLPGGVYVDLQKQELAELVIEGLEVTGISAKKLDADTLKIAGVAKFNDEDDADDADDAIENLMELQQFKKVDVSQEGLFLEASAELDIDDAESLF
jgi:hypothetical protein